MKRLLAAGLACVLCLAACATGPPATSPTTAAAPSGGSVPLEVAIRNARDLGVVPASMPMRFDLTLAYRDPAGLEALLGSGSRVTGAEFANRFGPDPLRVDAATRALAAAGLITNWSAGEVVLNVGGPAAAVEHFLHIAIHRYRAAGGSAFYAPPLEPPIPESLRGTVIAITGLDDYQRELTAAIPSADVDGVSPHDMSTFYDITPLHQAGLTGSGQTVAFLEWGVPAQQRAAGVRAQVHAQQSLQRPRTSGSGPLGRPAGRG